jgi:hypothetical protein
MRGTGSAIPWEQRAIPILEDEVLCEDCAKHAMKKDVEIRKTLRLNKESLNGS